MAVDRLGSSARKVSRLPHNGEKMDADVSQIYQTNTFLGQILGKVVGQILVILQNGERNKVLIFVTSISQKWTIVTVVDDCLMKNNINMNR